MGLLQLATPSHILYPPCLNHQTDNPAQCLLTCLCACLPFSQHYLTHFASISHLFLSPSSSVDLIFSLPSLVFLSLYPSYHGLLPPAVIKLSFIFNFSFVCPLSAPASFILCFSSPYYFLSFATSLLFDL